MRRRLLPLVLVLGVLLTGCDGDGSPSSEPPSVTTSPTVTASSSPEAAPQRVSTDEFCTLVGTVTTTDGGERQDAVLEVLQRGLPDDLTGDAKDGLQVFLDLAPELTGVRASVSAYRDLGRSQRADLRSFGWFITKSCGRDYLSDLLPDVPDLPSLPWR